MDIMENCPAHEYGAGRILFSNDIIYVILFAIKLGVEEYMNFCFRRLSQERLCQRAAAGVRGMGKGYGMHRICQRL